MNSPASTMHTPSARGTQAQTTLVLIIAVLAGLAAAVFLIAYLRQPEWQLTIITALFTLCALSCLAVARWLLPAEKDFLGLVVASITLALAITSCAAFIQGIGFTAAIIYLLFTLLISSTVSKVWQAHLLIVHGVIASAASALMMDFSHYPQIPSTLVTLLTPAVLGVLFMIYIVMVTMQFITSPLRIRLLTAFLAIVVVPLAGLSLIQERYTSGLVNDELNESLQQAAQQTALGIEVFLQDMQNSVTQPAKMPVFAAYLMLEPEQRSGSRQEQDAWLALRALAAKDTNPQIELTSFALLDMEGNVLYDTLSDRWLTLDLQTLGVLGIDIANPYEDHRANEGDQDYFLVPARSGVGYLSPMQIPQQKQSFLYASAPVKTSTGQTVGVLRLRMDGYRLQSTLRQFDHLLGSNSHPIVMDENTIHLADTYIPQNRLKAASALPEETLAVLRANRRLPDVPTAYLNTGLGEFAQVLAQSDQMPYFSLMADPEGERNTLPEIGAVARIQSMPWKVIYLQRNVSDAALRAEQRRLSTLVTTLIAAVVALVAIFAAHVLSGPIIQLTQTAQRIAAGNLNARAPARSSDEFGVLGSAFNSMTDQLRGLINDLEERVRARTEEIEMRNAQLANRAQQLQTVSDVARQIVSAQELTTLLSTLTQLISARFHFYHVGIFLLDETKEYAVLRAANSQGGQAMLERSHMLAVGKVGIVGYVTATGEARIASDVGTDAVHFQNPDLPETRAEMALPLRFGDEIIGALDIQSKTPDAFQPEDIELFATLADQVAVAIHNNQLFTETLRALNEAEQLHRQYLRQEWTQDSARRHVTGYVYTPGGVKPQRDTNPLWNTVFTSGEAVYAVLPGGSSAESSAVMAVPITVRGETIGVIHVQDQGEERLWSEDEITVVNNIASQVAVALENARLFETTVRRAEREKKVLQITDKIRSTNDPEEMMRIAVRELQQALNASRAQIFVRPTTGNGQHPENPNCIPDDETI